MGLKSLLREEACSLRLEALRARYEQTDEVEYYASLAGAGFYDYETALLKSMPDRDWRKKDVLVVGCGAGRESFAFEAQGAHSVTGTDISRALLSIAGKHGEKIGSKVSFLEGTVPASGSFDFVYITPNLLNHVVGKRQRVDILHGLKTRLKEGASIVTSVDIHPLGGFDRFSLTEKLFRFFAKGAEPGDTVRNAYGPAVKGFRPLLYHYYLNKNYFFEECTEAGLSAADLPHDFFRIVSR